MRAIGMSELFFVNGGMKHGGFSLQISREPHSPIFNGAWFSIERIHCG